MTTILVVDDEPLIANSLEAALADEGYEVMTAVNGRQALENLTRSPRPDLVLLDMMMPIMDGPSTLAAMAADPALRDIPVIIQTSLPKSAASQRVSNVAAILRKPYRIQELLSAIASIMGNKTLDH